MPETVQVLDHYRDQHVQQITESFHQTRQMKIMKAEPTRTPQAIQWETHASHIESTNTSLGPAATAALGSRGGTPAGPRPRGQGRASNVGRSVVLQRPSTLWQRSFCAPRWNNNSCGRATWHSSTLWDRRRHNCPWCSRLRHNLRCLNWERLPTWNVPHHN